MVVIGRAPGSRVLVTRLLAVCFRHDKRKQARLILGITHISIMRPLALINESLEARLFGIDGSQGRALGHVKRPQTFQERRRAQLRG